MHPAPVVRLGNVEIAGRVHGEAVTVRKVAELMAGAAEARDDLAARMIEDVHLFVAAVHHVQVLLLRIAREFGPPRGAAAVGQGRRAVAYPYVPLEIAELVEDLNAIALAVAYIDEPCV